MKFIKIFVMLGFVLSSLFSYATTILPSSQVSQINVRSELSSPIIMAGSEETNYLKVSLTGEKANSNKHVPINLALVIDKSGSMQGDRIVKAREAAIFAVNMLNEEDTLSIVTYDYDAKVIVPATKVKNKEQIIKLINKNLVAGGGTALFAGLSKGIKQVESQLTKDKVNRIILLSDGQANIGPSSVAELSQLAIIAAKKNIAITTMGIGSDYNEILMSSIASYSDGNHVFVNNTFDLEKMFVHEFTDVMSTVAQNVVITIQLKDGVKPVRLLGRDGVIKGNQVTIKMNQLFSNQEKYVLLEVIPEEGKVGQSKTLAQIDLSYDNLLRNKAEHETQFVSVAYTDDKKLVKDSMIQEVLAESEIQKVTIENEKALEYHNLGRFQEAEDILIENSKKLSSISNSVSSEEAKQRLRGQIEKNNIMADAAKADKDVFNKISAEKQFESKSNVIKK